MITAVGHSENPLASRALEEVLRQGEDSLQGRNPDLGIFFTSLMDLDFDTVLSQILEKWPGMQLVGCTTDGEISHTQPSIECSMALLLIESDKVKFSVGLGENLSGNPQAAVNQALDQAGYALDDDCKLAVVLADGIETFSTHMGQALRTGLGDNFPIFGGCSGDNMQLVKTYQFFNNKVVSDSVVLILVSGPVRFSMSQKSGWKPIGKLFNIGRYKDNVVWEIDGMKAVDFYRKYLGENFSAYHQFPLAVEATNPGFFLRDPIDMNSEDGSISFIGTFPENARVQLTEFSTDSLIEAASEATEDALMTYPGKSADLALLFPCASRRHVLGIKAVEDHRKLIEHRKINSSMSIFGMYAYGEFAPVKSTGKTYFHNDTYTVLLLGEEL
ncbi:MAG: FIST signal transduction protein [Desulfonatronovibrio sp.]